MQNKSKTQILGTILSVLVSVFLVTGVVYAITTISATTITLSNGATIDNATNGVFQFTGGKIVLSPTFSAADASNQAVEADATLGASFGTSTAADSNFGGAVMGNIWGTNLTKKYNYIGGLIGQYSVDGTNASTYPTGAVLGAIGDGTTTAKGAFVAYIDGDSGAPTAAGAAFKAMNLTSTPGVPGFSYGLDLYDNNTDPDYLPLAFGTADIRLQNGETISNATDGVVAISGNLKIASPTTLTVTGTDPGTQVKLQYATTAMTGGQLQGIQVAATVNLAADTGATGGITGIESKARQTTGSTFAVNQLRGIIGTADARNAPVTTIYGIEANISSATGATVTTAVGLQVSQQLASDGAGSSAIYGISIKADNVANTADIQLSGGVGNPTIRPTISSGSGVPDNANCTATTNLGSLYINTAGTDAGNTLLYICEENGNWIAIATP